jgi:chromosome partitioning protein
MRIIAIFSPLGGVGKTTLAVNLAASMAELGKRVLLVDLDAQSSATMALGLAMEKGGSLYSALVDGTSPKDVVRSTRLPNLFVIRSHYELASVDVCLVQRGQHLSRLREVMAELRALPDFDCIFLDCSPSMGVMTSAAMAVADELLVPLQPGFMMLPALSQMLRQIQQVIESGVNPGLHVGGFVINRFNGDAGQLKEIAHELHALAQPNVSGNVAYPTAIPESTALAEAPCYGQTILEYDPQGRGTEAYRALAKEFLERHNFHLTHSTDPASCCPCHRHI